MTSQKYFNGIVERDIRNGATLLNIGNEIVNSLGLYKSYSFSKSMDKRYVVVNSNKIIGAKGCCFLTDGTATVLSASDVKERQVFEKDSELFGTKVDVVFSSDNLEECLSFISWVDSKLVRFLVLINISKLGPCFTDHYFHFAPAPPSGKFDHIYTDQELYNAFNLPQKYKDVIEAVIKERK